MNVSSPIKTVLVPIASPSSSVFYLGGSVEFSNLSFSPDLADPTSPQFRLQSEALSHYVSISIHNGLPAVLSNKAGLAVISLECGRSPETTQGRCSPLALSNAKPARSAAPVVRSYLIVTLLNVNRVLSTAPPSFRPLRGPLKCKASCNWSPARCEAAR